MKRIVFITTSGNQKQMHKRFQERLVQFPEYRFTSLDVRTLLIDFLDSYAFFNAILNHSILRKIINVLVRQLNYFLTFLFAKRLADVLERALVKLDPSCIVLSDNYYSFVHGIIIRFAKDRKIKILCVPFVNQQFEDILLSRYHNKAVSSYSTGVLGTITKFFFPKWASLFRGKKILWAHPLEIFTLKKLQLFIEDPKPGVGNLMDAVLVSGTIAKNRFIEYGVSLDKIHIVGDIAYDNFYENLKPRKEKSLLFSICPKLTFPIVYGNHENYIKSYLKELSALKEKGWRVLINPHPSVKRGVCELIESLEFSIDYRDISEILPEVDVYITSYSSTLLWASTLDIKCIDHDIYGFGYVGNAMLPNVDRVVTHQELLFKLAIATDSFDSSNFANLDKQKEILKSKLIDGQTLERFLSHV